MTNREVLRLGSRNFIYAVMTQIITYLLNFVLLFIVPRELGVEQYSYWQLYVFYVSYIGFLQFGFNDGIYLRYGHFEYDQLPYPLFRTYFFLLFISQILFSATFIFVLLCGMHNEQMLYPYVFAALAIPIVGTNAMFIMVYQATNRIKQYSALIVLDKIFALFLICIAFIVDVKNYRYLIGVDFSVKLLIFLINIYINRVLVFGGRKKVKSAIPEIRANIVVGIKLMLANIMGMLLLGLGRILVERFMSLTEFGLYSFAISLTSLSLLFISSISLVLYPMLCRINQDSLSRIFIKFDRLLVASVVSMLLTYFPIEWIVKRWLTQYTPVLDYLYLLFPIVISQSKMLVLMNNYYKALRDEKSMLRANISSVLLFCLLAVPLFFIFRSVKVVVLCTLLTLAWRCYASEIYLMRRMEIQGNLSILKEILLISFFILSAGFLPILWGLLLYITALFTFILMDYGELIDDLNSIKRLYFKSNVI